MAQGSGLPLPKTGDARTAISGVMDGDKLSSATAWGRIAQVGKQLAASAERVGELEIHQQQARHVAETENADADALVKLRDQNAFNPQGFEAAARGYLDGKVEESPGWDVARRKRYIGGKLEATLGTILNETRSRDTRLAGEALDSRRQSADNEVMGLATAGKVGTPDWAAANATYQGVLDTAVTTKLISPEKAEYLRDELAGRAQGEHAGRSAVSVYRERGFAAASDYLQKNILENDGLSLKPSQRQAIFNRGMAAIRLAQTEDKDARNEVVTASKDLRSRITSQQPVDDGEVADTIEGLRRSGAAGELHRLSVAWGVRQQTDPFRTGNLSLKQMAGTVATARGTAVQSANAQSAMQFFQSRGYTPVQAAGIVGNLVQESGPLDPTLSHDGGTGVGIAGWRLERRTALRQFAAARGKGETDFQTQLEFLDQELQTSEAGAGARLKAAKTPAEAAEAFIHFERPAGYTAANPRGGHGFANRVANAERLAGQQPAAVPYAGEIAKGVQGVFVQQIRGAWPKFKEQIDKGVALDEDDLTSIRYAAALSGDANWQREVEGIATAQRVGQGLGDAPAAERSAGLGQVQEELKRAGLPVIDQQTIVGSLEKQFERQNKQARDNPVAYWIDRGGAAPEPLNLNNAQAARAGAADRYSVARLVAMREGIPPATPFVPAEQQAIAAAIRGGSAEQTAAAFETLHAAPDDLLVPTLKSAEIKGAIVGAAHSTDPARFMSSMSALDRLYARAPEDVAAIYGSDVFKQLQDWQAKLRYHSPQELAEVLKRRDDPQVREREKLNIEAGEKIAREKKPDSLIGEWQSAFGLFGAGAPVDARTRDAWMADYVNLFGERYAVSLDKSKAHEQTIERMKHYWQKSSVNGGRLTLYPPELTYNPDASGSFDWMRKDLENDIKTKTGRAASDYTIIADPTTQREVDNRVPASYLIAVKNDQTGEWDLMRGADQQPQRYKWDAGKAKQDARDQFQRQRERTTEAQQVLNPGFDMFGTAPAAAPPPPITSAPTASGAQSVDETGFTAPQQEPQSGAQSVDEAGLLNPAAPEASGAASVDEAGFSSMATKGEVPAAGGSVAAEQSGAASFDEAGFAGVGRSMTSPQGRYAVEGLPIKQGYKPGQTFGKEATANAKPFSSIIVHHTGTDNLRSALNTSKGDPFRGGDTFGYHFYIDMDGSVTQGAPLDARTNHVQPPDSPNRIGGRDDIGNSNAVGISFVGKSNNYTQAQLESAAKLAEALMRDLDIPLDNVVGHGEVQKNRKKDEGLSLVELIRSKRARVASR